MEVKPTLLDSKGRVEHDDDRFNKPGVLHAYAGNEYDEAPVPDHIKRNLDKAKEVAGPFEPRNSIQTWEETLYAPTADGATYTTPAAEATMVPIFTLPANYLYTGRTLKWTVLGRMSTPITTPGNYIFKLAYSATGLGAVIVAASTAVTPDPTAASTAVTFMVEWWAICRSTGTAGSMLGIGRIELPDIDDATVATIKTHHDARMAPAATPAAVAIDTTVARSLNPTYTPSVTTASMTAHMAILEAIT